MDGPETALADLGADGRQFALLYRPDAAGIPVVEVLTGDLCRVDRLADLPLPAGPAGGERHDLLVAIPYRQIAERGFACHDDHADLLAMRVREQAELTRDQALATLPDENVPV